MPCGVCWGLTPTHEGSAVYVATAKPLFAWDCLQDSPSLRTVKQFLASIPDAKLLEGLRRHRGRGRNDCPVPIAWGVLLLRIALRHVSVEAALAELGRNEALRRLIGIAREENVPKSWNISRFLDTLGHEPHRSDLRRIFDAMVERLYNGRTSVERVNARLKIFWGVDDGDMVGARRFHAMVGAVLIVHVAFATLLAAAPRRKGTLGKLRLGPIQKALAQHPAA
jgi:hypothetical protein